MLTVPTDERGCGFVQLHGLYFVSGQFVKDCDRPIIEIPQCECCGNTLKFNLGQTKINPQRLFGNHSKEVLNFETGETSHLECRDKESCLLCYPKEFALLDWVGQKFYSMESFNKEAAKMGVSRKLATQHGELPAGFKVGETPIYFAMKGIIDEVRGQNIISGKIHKKDGVFMAFVPTRLEYMIYEEEITKHSKTAHKLKEKFETSSETDKYGNKFLPEANFSNCKACDMIETLYREGITPVIVPKDDERFNQKKTKEKFTSKKISAKEKKLIAKAEVQKKAPEPQPTEEVESPELEEELPEPQPSPEPFGNQNSLEQYLNPVSEKVSSELSEAAMQDVIKDSESYPPIHGQKEVDKEVIQIAPLTLEEKAEKGALPEAIEEKSETIEINEAESEKQAEEIKQEVWNVLSHEDKLKLMNGSLEAVELLNVKYQTPQQKEKFSEALAFLDKKYNTNVKPQEKETPELIETPLLDELALKYGTTKEQVQFQKSKDEINKAIFESGETTISEQVKMEAMQKEYDSTHKAQELRECVKCNKFYEKGEKECPECLKIAEMEKFLKEKNKKTKVFNIKDPKDKFLSQEEEAMGSDEDFDENQIGGQ